MRILTIVLLFAGLTWAINRVEARPPPPPCEVYERAPALLDVSTWMRLGGSWGKTRGDGALASQTPRPPGSEPIKFDVGFASAVGADATIALSKGGALRAGPWAEVAFTDFDTASPVAGLELQLGRAPSSLNIFQYRGQGQVTARLGVGTSIGSSLPKSDVLVGALTYGYLAPWDLFPDHGRCDRRSSLSRYMIGARFVVTVMQSIEAPEFWLATVGIEFEPAGALRYLLGIRDWY